MYMNFSSEFTLLDKNCSLMSGFNKKLDDSNVSCTRIEGKNSYLIDNFDYIDSSVRLTIAALIRTPDVEGTYPV